jgi:ketosteroid isomerase-like protein
MAPFTRLWDAYGRGRLDDALDLIDEDCEVRAVGSDRVYRGHDGVRAVFAESRRRWKSITLTSDEVVEVDDATIVAIARLTAFDHSGARVHDGPLAWMAEFDDGRLLRATYFATRADALDAAGRRRSATG